MTKNIQTRHHYSMLKQNKIVYYDFAITNCNHALLNSINQIEQQICCRKLQTAFNINIKPTNCNTKYFPSKFQK